jgi:hypothetical protein
VWHGWWECSRVQVDGAVESSLSPVGSSLLASGLDWCRPVWLGSERVEWAVVKVGGKQRQGREDSTGAALCGWGLRGSGGLL